MYQKEMGCENYSVFTVGLLPNSTSNVAMEDNEQGRAFQRVEPRATEIYEKGCSSLRAEAGYNPRISIDEAEDLHNNHLERFYYL